MPTSVAVTDPEMFKRRFVAEFTLVSPERIMGVPNVDRTPASADVPLRSGGRTSAVMVGQEPVPSLRQTIGIDLDHYSAVVASYNRFLGQINPSGLNERLFFSVNVPAPVMTLIVEGMPPGHEPSEDVVTMLTENRYPKFDSHLRFVQDTRTIESRFTILAPTPERAEALVRGLLSLLDYGVFYPLQAADLRAKQEHEKDLAMWKAHLDGTRKELATLSKRLAELKEYEDLSDTVVTELTVELRRIDVDLAGVGARIEACNAILQTLGKLPPVTRYEQVEALKTAADIELVGLEARESALRRLIGIAQRRTQVSHRVHEVDAANSEQVQRLRWCNDAIASFEADLEKLIPSPVEGGKVTIYPVKWVPPEK
jgi:hypothetical protein